MRTAHLRPGAYRPGDRTAPVRFYTVQCDTCGTILNSGHHYQDEGNADLGGTLYGSLFPSRHALELVVEHNETEHLGCRGHHGPDCGCVPDYFDDATGEPLWDIVPRTPATYR